MIIAIIQARQTSKRFKNKIFFKINGTKIIDWIITRTKKIKKVDKIIFAIPGNKKNSKLKNFLKKKKLNVFAGSENNVLSRFTNIIKKNNADTIIRICADSPFVCPKEVDNLINFYKKNKCDYAYNHIPLNNLYPDGIGAEIASAEKILEFSKFKLKRNQKEHIFNYVHQNKKKYIIKTFDPKIEFLKKPFLKLDIDYKKQYLFFKNKKISPSMDIKSIIKKLFK